MNLIESFISALSSLLGNKMRSLLTMLGIIIGISAVIVITSMGQGFQASINDELSKMGSIGLQVSMKYDEELTARDMLTLDDVELINTHPNVADVAPYTLIRGRIRLKNPSETDNVLFIGTNGSFKDVQGIDLREGRFLVQPDVDNTASTIVIDSFLARKIFGNTDVIGKTVHSAFNFGSIELTVVGVYNTVNFSSSMFQMPTIAYIPISTLQKINNSRYVDSFFVNVKDRDSIERTALEISKLLALRHGNENKYSVDNLLQQIDTVNNILGSITAFVGLVAAISLFVGGIGVMNIMLVTVTERTYEIGIRKSLGATNGNIYFQFLVEAIILTAIGGAFGIILGYYGSFALGNFIGITPSVSAPIVALTMTISSLVGIIFGVYPAGKAARLDPIEALRRT
ncbi:MAG: ABC transporter permease [Oscillospiraceae bacterium]|nr:ABC transporter permease [Oscillospiraceae bacterium]